MEIDFFAIKRALNELSKLNTKETQIVFFQMLSTEKVNFKDLSETYVEYLETRKKDLLYQLMEAEICVSEHLIDVKYETKGGRRPKGYKEDKDNHIQRSLYLLNKSNRFNTNHLNEYFNYNEEKAKELSWYEREKKNKKCLS